jgi:hypothetical protein
MLVKFWKGSLKPKQMATQEGWLAEWLKAALEAEQQNCQLVVFMIPKDRMKITADHETVEEIEELLQKKFPEN